MNHRGSALDPSFPNMIAARLQEVGAYCRGGHYVYTSGQHGAEYLDKEAVYTHPDLTKVVCRRLVEPWSEHNIEAVVAPALGGIALTQWIAYHLMHRNGRAVLAVYAKKVEDGFAFTQRRAQLISGKRVLVAEDVLTTGGTARKTVDLVRAHGGIVVGVTVIWNRGNVTSAALGVARHTELFAPQLVTYPAESCPRCEQHVPANVDLGHGRKFLAERAAMRT